MSLQTEIIAVTASLANGKVYPQMVDEDVRLPFIVYRVLSKAPLETLSGGTIQMNVIVEFDCYADSYLSALTLADQLRNLIDASPLVSYETSAPGEQYEQTVDVFMEPVYYGFWHTA